MDAQNEPNGIEIFDQWKMEHQVIERYTAGLVEWIASQSKLRSQQFQETVKKLTELNGQLESHFEREKHICEHLRATHRECPVEADAVQRQIDRDHANISTRLKQLIHSMQGAEFEQDAWKKSVHELGLIIDLIEQHDEQESESVSCLLPPASF